MPKNFKWSANQQFQQNILPNNEAVRKTLLERGIRPEKLPAAEDVKKVARRLASDEKKALENPNALEPESNR